MSCARKTNYQHGFMHKYTVGIKIVQSSPSLTQYVFSFKWYRRSKI